MACPRADELPALLAVGIGAVLTLTGREPPHAAHALGLATRHEPVEDFHPPSPEQLLSITAWIREQVGAGRAVAVHCMAGLGRTGTVLAAWLVAEGAEPDRAIAEVRARRPGSIETREQEGAVHAFARALAGRGDREIAGDA